MTPNETGVWVLAGIGVAALLYYAAQQTGDSTPVPSIQGESQTMGLGVEAGLSVKAGSPLDMAQKHHGWSPGYDPDPTAQPVTQSRCRYPALPGGNISTVMHKGWSAMSNDAPSDNDWRLNPPEAAVILCLVQPGKSCYSLHAWSLSLSVYCIHRTGCCE